MHNPFSPRAFDMKMSSAAVAVAAKKRKRDNILRGCVLKDMSTATMHFAALAAAEVPPAHDPRTANGAAQGTHATVAQSAAVSAVEDAAAAGKVKDFAATALASLSTLRLNKHLPTKTGLWGRALNAEASGEGEREGAEAFVCVCVREREEEEERCLCVRERGKEKKREQNSPTVERANAVQFTLPFFFYYFFCF